jgi:hypothetical protein
LVKKSIILSFALLSCTACLLGQNRSNKDSATVIITLDNVSNQNKEIDSIYLVFDSYDRSGAGIVKQVFHPVNNKIALLVPKGKYYVDLYCLGTFNDRRFNQVIIARRKRLNRLSVKLKYEAFFTPGFVDIPKEQIDLANLSVTRYNSYK